MQLPIMVHFCPICGFPHLWNTEVHGSQNKLGRWVTVFSPNDISGLRRSKNVKFATWVASSTRMMLTLTFLEKVFLIVAEFKKRQKHQLVAPRICRNNVYVAPPCEWILNTLPQTVRSTEDLVTIISHLTCSVMVYLLCLVQF